MFQQRFCGHFSVSVSSFCDPNTTVCFFCKTGWSLKQTEKDAFEKPLQNVAKSQTAFGLPLSPSLANLEFLCKTKLAQGPGSRNFSGRQKPQTAILLTKGLEMGPFKCLRAQRPAGFHFWPPRYEFLSTTSFHDSRSLVLFLRSQKCLCTQRAAPKGCGKVLKSATCSTRTTFLAPHFAFYASKIVHNALLTACFPATFR